MKSGSLSLIIRADGYSVVVIRPGRIFQIGRGKTNDLIINDSTVSRSHATISWDLDDKFPRICDNNSTSGTKVDEESISFRHLTGVHNIKMGETTITLEYADSEAQVPTQMQMALTQSSHAILVESSNDDEVTLFREYGSEDTTGTVNSNEELRSLLKELENRGRTGTLHLTSDVDSWIVFAIGKVCRARCGAQRAEQALHTIVSLPKAKYRFTIACGVGEASLNISISCYLRALRLSLTRRRSRL
jgi:hypothetical protein